MNDYDYYSDFSYVRLDAVSDVIEFVSDEEYEEYLESLADHSDTLQ